MKGFVYGKVFSPNMELISIQLRCERVSLIANARFMRLFVGLPSFAWQEAATCERQGSSDNDQMVSIAEIARNHKGD